MKRLTPVRCVLTFVVGASAALHGMFIRPEIATVPVDRLTSNLERQLKENPSDVEARLNLARLHGMAYALKTDSAEVVTRGGRQDVWYGFSPNLIPYKTNDAATKAQAADAKKHLEAAISEYERVLKLDPGNLTARLGYAWARDQSGDKGRAIPEYRRVIDQAWPKESVQKTADLGGHFYTSEAAGYLIPLLDPKSDAAEIAQLTERRARLERVPRPITPIVIPLSEAASRDCAPPLDPFAPARFDADGSGVVRDWTWISSDAAWLVHDPLGTGAITSGLQLFGNVSFWLFWRNGYEALRALDDDNNGWLEGTELAGLALWRDSNHNGRSDPGEVLTLAAAGIISISVNAVPGSIADVAAWSPGGVRLEDGRTRPSWDVILHQGGGVEGVEGSRRGFPTTRPR